MAMIIPPEGYALLDTIAGPESAGDYNVIYGGQRFNDYSDHPRIAVTIQSGPNKGQTSSAAGKYQFLGPSWDRYQRKLNLSDFSPHNQDLAAWQYAQDEYFYDTGRDLLSDLQAGDISRVPGSLRNVWTSMPGGIEQGITGTAFGNAYTRNLGNHPVPPLGIGGRVNAMFDAMPPVPKDRSQGTVARTKQALGLNTPKPANMPVGVRTQRMLNSLPPNPAPLTQRPRKDSIIERNRVSNKLPVIGPTGGPPLNGNAPFPATMSNTLANRRRNWNGDPGVPAGGQVIGTIATNAPTRRGNGGLAALSGVPQLPRRNATGSFSGARGLAALGNVPQLQQPRRGPGLTGVGLMALGGLVPQLPRTQRQPPSLRVTVNGAGTYQPPIPQQRPAGLGVTPVQQVQALTGLSSAQAYDLLNANARGSLGVADRITGAGTQASSGSSANSISSW